MIKQSLFTGNISDKTDIKLPLHMVLSQTIFTTCIAVLASEGFGIKATVASVIIQNRR